MRANRRRRFASRAAFAVPVRLPLAGEHQLAVSRRPGEDALVLSDQSGSVCLTVVITAGSVTVAVTGAKLAFRTDAALELHAEHLILRGRAGIAIETEGALVSRGRTQQITATQGGVTIEANDDVKLDGERILLNS